MMNRGIGELELWGGRRIRVGAGEEGRDKDRRGSEGAKVKKTNRARALDSSLKLTS